MRRVPPAKALQGFLPQPHGHAGVCGIQACGGGIVLLLLLEFPARMPVTAVLAGFDHIIIGNGLDPFGESVGKGKMLYTRERR